MRAFITGITGQDGWYLNRRLLAAGTDVYALVRRCAGRQALPENVHVMEGDIRDPGIVMRVAAINPDEIYNLAALSHVGQSFTSPTDVLETNTKGCLHMLEAAMRCDARFVQASTSEMFGNQKAPQGIDAHLAPVSPYGVSKLAAHHLVKVYRSSYGVHAATAIMFNHESPRRGDDFVTQKVVRAAVRIAQSRGSPGWVPRLQLGNMDATRDWGHADDYMGAMMRIVRHENAYDWIVATGESHSVLELVEYVFGRLELDWQQWVDISESEMRPTDVQHLRGDTSLTDVGLRWTARRGFEAVIDDMIEAAL